MIIIVSFACVMRDGASNWAMHVSGYNNSVTWILC